MGYRCLKLNDTMGFYYFELEERGQVVPEAVLPRLVWCLVFLAWPTAVGQAPFVLSVQDFLESLVDGFGQRKGIQRRKLLP